MKDRHIFIFNGHGGTGKTSFINLLNDSKQSLIILDDFTIAENYCDMANYFIKRFSDKVPAYRLVPKPISIILDIKIPDYLIIILHELDYKKIDMLLNFLHRDPVFKYYNISYASFQRK